MASVSENSRRINTNFINQYQPTKCIKEQKNLYKFSKQARLFRIFQAILEKNKEYICSQSDFNKLQMYQKQIMSTRRRRKQVSLPPLKEDCNQMAKVIAFQIKPHTDCALRYKTQPFSDKHQKSRQWGHQMLQNVCHVPQVYQNAINKEKSKQKVEKNSKGKNVSQIIDTRKSIKILINYFDSKSQEQKNRNSNCYHSPRKQSYQHYVINTPNRYMPTRKVINLKKIKLKQKKAQTRTQSNQTPIAPKKLSYYQMKDVMKIDTLLIDTSHKERISHFSVNMKQAEQTPGQKLNNFTETISNSVLKFKPKEQPHQYQRKLTKFQGWPIENDTNYLQ